MVFPSRAINGCSVTALAVALAIFASEAATAQTGPTASGQAEVPQSADNSQIRDIVVTAQRRAQKLQDVPIAVNAISGEAAMNAGITGTVALQQSVPALQISRNANGATPFLRGIGSSIGNPNGEGSVAIYVDGVYQPAANSNVFEFNNIERVEVLKGPQGTLFGRNATGGVIQIVTKDPSQTPEMDVSFGYANYETVTANAYVAGGIAENLSAGVSLLYKNRNEGWGTQLLTGLETPGGREFAVRGKLLLTPGDDTEIRLAGDYSKSRNAISLYQPVPGAANIVGQGYPGRYNTTAGFHQDSKYTSRGASLTINHDFGAVQLASISAFKRVNGSYSVDQDVSPVPLVTGFLNSRNKMYSQEVHLLSASDSRLQWLVGAYYINYSAKFSPLLLRGLAFDPTNPDAGIDAATGTRARSVALFAQATYPIDDNTNLTAGFRYSWERTRYEGSFLVGGTNIIIVPINGVPARSTFSYGKPTWRISLDHKFAPDVLGYVSYNRGIKSGSFGIGSNPTKADGLTPLDPYQPEQLDAYEVGLKTEFLDRHLRLNVSGFYYDFKNIQFQKVENASVVIFNGPSARSYGAEVDLEARVTPNLTLTAGGSYLHTRIGDFPGAPNTQRDPVTGLNNGGDPTFNAKGNRLPFAPKYSVSAGFTYNIPTNIGTFDVNGHLYYNSGAFSEIDNRLDVGSYEIVNASVGWTDPGNKLSIRLWGKNLTKTYYYVQLSGIADLTDIGAPNEPRTYGATARIQF